MRIKSKDMPLILALLENPTATQQELKDAIKEFADHTWDVSNISRKLTKFFDPEDGIMNGVQATFNLSLLNLELHGFVVELEDDAWNRNYDIIHQLVILHPYASYMNKIYGHKNGVYLQFYVPKKSDVGLYIARLLDYLITAKVVKEYDWIKDLDFVISSSGSLGVWDPWTSYWDVDFDKLEHVLNTVYEPIFIPKRRSVLHKLKDYDMAVIRELSKNLRRSQIEIMESLFGDLKGEEGYDPYRNVRDKFPKSKQSLSRKIQWIEDFGFIKSKWLMFDREKFGLLNQILFVMDRDEIGLAALVKSIELEVEAKGMTTKGEYTKKNKILPYPCNVSVNSDKIVLWLYLQPLDLLKFSDLFTSRFQGVEIYILGVDPKAYYFNNVNFDSDTRQWKTQPVYVYDEILYQLKEILEMGAIRISDPLV